MVIRLWQKRCRSLRTFRETSGFRKRADSTFRLKSSRERLAVKKVPRIIHVFLHQVPTLLSSRTLRITLNPDFLFESRYDLGKSPWVDYTLITNRWNIFRRAVELVWSRCRILILAFARQALFFFGRASTDQYHMSMSRTHIYDVMIHDALFQVVRWTFGKCPFRKIYHL